MDPFDGSELELVCLCGYEHFERVVVQRKPHPPIVTDFVACVGCRAMYFAPVPKSQRSANPPGHGIGSGGPALEPHERFMDDVRDAAKDYVKPGRHTPPRHRRK